MALSVLLHIFLTSNIVKTLNGKLFSLWIEMRKSYSVCIISSQNNRASLPASWINLPPKTEIWMLAALLPSQLPFQCTLEGKGWGPKHLHATCGNGNSCFWFQFGVHLTIDIFSGRKRANEICLFRYLSTKNTNL